MAESPLGGTGEGVVAGASWTALSRVGLQVFSMISATVLARFVSPRAYGLVGMAQVVIGFAAMFGSIGTSSAIIRQKKIDDDLLSSVYWLNLMIGVGVTAACCLGAPFVAQFYNEPALTAIFRTIGFYFAISSMGTVHGALMNRNFQFARLAATDLVAGAASVIVGVVCAVMGAGVWSLLAGGLTNAAVTAALYITFDPWRPALRFSFRRLGPVLGFGLNLSGFNIVNYFSRNADNLLIGKYLGAIPLAYYNWGYTLMLYPLQTITWTLGRVLFPAFSQMQEDPERFRRAYLRACSAIAFVTFPLMAGVTVVAPEFIVVLLGPKWRPVAPVLRILAPVGMMQSIAATTGNIYMAMGKTDLMFRWSLVFTGLTVTGFVIGLHWGIIGVATAYAIVAVITLVPTFWIPFQLIRLPALDLWVELWPITRAAATMAVATAALRWLVLGSVQLPPIFALLAFVLFGGAVYFATMYWRSRPLLVGFSSLARTGLRVFGQVNLSPARVLGRRAALTPEDDRAAMRILVEPSTTHCLNVGDLAMMMVLSERIQDLRPGAVIRMRTAAPGALSAYLPRVTPIPSALPQTWLAGSSLLGGYHQHLPAFVSRPVKDLEYRLWTKFPNFIALGARLKQRLKGYRSVDPSQYLKEITSSALVVVSGAGILNDEFLESALALCDVLGAAIRNDVPVLLFGQGIGPITNPELLRKAREVLPLVRFIGLREGCFGPQLLASLGVSPSAVEITGDDAIELAFRKRPERLGCGMGANLRLSTYSGMDTELSGQVWTVLERAMRKLDAPLVPVPISFHPDESDLRELARFAGPSRPAWMEMPGRADPLRVIAQVAACRIVVTGSYHAGVFALSQGIPAVCIENSTYYAQKFRGLQAQFGDGCTVVAVGAPDFSRCLEDAIYQAWASAERLRAPLLDVAAAQIERGRAAYARAFAACGVVESEV